MSQAVVGRRYAHFKDPSHIYQVVEVGVIDSETLLPRVSYRQLYSCEKFPEGTIWSRTQESFEAQVLGKGFMKVDRFQLLDDPIPTFF